jgi:hypothetical protein
MADQISDQIKSLLAQSAMSFVGTVTHLQATTMPDLPVDDHTAVVTVDHVLHAPPEFVHMEGHRITVELSPNATLPKIGESAAFFVQGLAFGESVAVREIGRLPVDAVAPRASAAAAAERPAGAFSDLQQELRDDTLRAHMNAADAVVVGWVVGVAKAGPSPRREHDPDWWVATIQVDHVERGNATPGPIKVLFPASRDVRWNHVPKCSPAQSGAWVLHATQGELQELAPYQLQDANDYLPTQKLNLIR